MWHSDAMKRRFSTINHRDTFFLSVRIWQKYIKPSARTLKYLDVGIARIISNHIKGLQNFFSFAWWKKNSPGRILSIFYSLWNRNIRTSGGLFNVKINVNGWLFLVRFCGNILRNFFQRSEIWIFEILPFFMNPKSQQ